MIKHVWSVLCRKTTIDSETNNISLLDVFEELQAKVNLPQDKINKLSIPLEYEVVNFWLKEDSLDEAEIEIEISLIDPNNKNLKTFVNKIKIPNKMKRMRSRLRIVGMPISTSGLYHFLVKFKEKTNNYKQVADLPVEISIGKT